MGVKSFCYNETMTKQRPNKRIIVSLIIIVVIALMAVVGLLVYLKIQRITESLKNSAQKATSENTPLIDQ